MRKTSLRAVSLAVVLSAAVLTPRDCPAGFCLSFGIGSKFTCIDLFCDGPGEQCVPFQGIVVSYCKCLITGLTPPAPPPFFPSPDDIHLDMSLQNDLLSVSGQVTSSPFAGDPLIGAPIAFSGPLGLFLTETESNGDGVALFEPSSPVTVTFGNFLSGQVQSALYVEDGNNTDRPFSISVTNVVAGSQDSPWVDAYLANNPNRFLDLGGDFPVAEFSNIESHNGFSTTGMDGVAVPVNTPEPSSVALAGVSTACIGAFRWRRRRAVAARF